MKTREMISFLPLINNSVIQLFCMDDQEFVANLDYVLLSFLL